MSNGWINRRKIIESKKATQSIGILTKKHRRFEEQWKGLKWRLERKPEKGTPIRPESGDLGHLMYVDGDTDYDLVEISVAYTYDKKR